MAPVPLLARRASAGLSQGQLNTGMGRRLPLPHRAGGQHTRHGLVLLGLLCCKLLLLLTLHMVGSRRRPHLGTNGYGKRILLYDCILRLPLAVSVCGEDGERFERQHI